MFIFVHFFKVNEVLTGLCVPTILKHMFTKPGPYKQTFKNKRDAISGIELIDELSQKWILKKDIKLVKKDKTKLKKHD